MFASPAAKRTALLVLTLPLLLLSASLSLADEQEKSPFLGVVLQDITSSMGKALQLDEDRGVMISEVVEDSAAEKAGLEDGDIILEFNGKEIATHKQLTRAIGKTSPGDKVELLILRAGKEKKLSAEMGEHEKNYSFSWNHGKNGKTIVIEGDGEDLHHKLMEFHEDLDLEDLEELDDIHVEILKEFQDGEHSPHVMIRRRGGGKDGDWTFFDSDRGYMGVHLDDIDGQMAEYFEVKDGGALVTEVAEDSPAEQAGLKAGDVIVKLDDQDIHSTSALHKAMADTEKDQEVQVQVVRKGDRKTLKVKLGEMDEEMAGLRFFDKDDHFTVRAPKMVFHGKRHPRVQVFPDGDDEEFFEWHGDGELQDVREELKQLKEELKELRKEFKK